MRRRPPGKPRRPRFLTGNVHIGVTPWIEDLKRQYEETGVNPLAGATNIEFRLPDGRVIRSERRENRGRRISDAGSE